MEVGVGSHFCAYGSVLVGCDTITLTCFFSMYIFMLQIDPSYWVDARGIESQYLVW